MNQKLSKNEKGDKGDNNGNTKKGEYRNETKDQYEEQQENESFMGNLNVVTRDEDDSVVKVSETMENKEGCSSAPSGCGKENPWNLYKTWEGKNLVDIVNASKLDNKILEIPTKFNEDGSEVLIFDDELIDLGMWNRFGLRDVIAENEIFFFKFQDEEGIKEVINNGPWMVNNKPMYVQKWCIDMCLDKVEPKKLPVWVKMLKMPMEAWSVKGISALASSLGKLIIMDEVTTRMCVTSVRRIGFARVLIEIDAEKEIKDRIEIIYKGKMCRVKNKSEHSTNVEQTDENEFKTWNVGRNPRENTRKPNTGKYEYRKMMKEITNVKGIGVNNKGPQKDVGNNTKKENNYVQNKTNTKESNNDKNSPKEGELKGISKSNRFTLLNELVDEDELVPSLNEREIVDSFVNNRIHPTENDMKKWNSFMIRYYEGRKEIIDVMDDMDSEDVVEEVNGAEKSCLRNEVKGVASWNIKGLDTSEKQKEVQKLINEEKTQLMTVLETHLKYKNVKNLCDKVFVSGDFNVTLVVNEHSSGSSFSSNDMNEFHECTNDVKLEDVNGSGFFFTWTKSLKNHDCRTYKKLDRIMVNEDLIIKYPDTHGCFLPFLMVNHSLSILIMKNDVTKKKRAFRFPNFVTKRNNFHKTVEEVWKQQMSGYSMYRLVKKLKNLKGPLNKMLGKRCELLNEYNIARKEEDNMLYQKAKVEWLNEEDRNTFFFHKVLKERKHRSKIMAIYDESRKRYENEEVADQFLKHFKEFLGKEDKKVSDKEVKKALFNIEDDKALGPGKLLCEVNATVISFVPKSVLGKLLDENQSAFIAGRQITDNILLAQELLRGYNRKSSRKKYISSAKVIKRTLEEFCGISGVPLITRHLSVSECKPLIEKVKKKILDWKNIALTYAGRLYSEIIWKKMQTKLLSKLVCGAAVYYLWNERNSRLFGGTKRNEEALSLEIEEYYQIELGECKGERV
ncbi:RNA-directed DNA polymerase, eukaryota, reverse transcriptase zinc-binding domain protein [Tanacetum coccineum]